MRSFIIRTLCALLLFGSFASLFFPTIKVTEKANGTTITEETYSGFEIIKGTLVNDKDDKAIADLNENGSEGEQFAFFMKTTGEENGMGTKTTSLIFGFSLIILFMCTALGGLAVLISLFFKSERLEKFFLDFAKFFGVLAVIGAVIASVASFLWVDGSFAIAGAELGTQTIKSTPFISMIAATIAILVATQLLYWKRLMRK